MHRPAPLLAAWTFFAGALLLVASAGLQVALLNDVENAADDRQMFLSFVLQGFTAAAGLTIAAGLVLAIWSFVASD